MGTASSIFESRLLTVQNDLFRFALKLTSDRDDAYDLLQETSLKALDNKDKFIPETNFRGWIFTIMRNVFINNFRRLSKDQSLIERTEDYYTTSLKADHGFESTDSAYDVKEIHRAIGALPEEFRLPFSMHVSGFKYNEIAERLNLPVGTVKSRIFTTRQRLQKELKDFI